MLNNKGFTLVELLAVLIILGVILGVTIPNIVGITTANKLQAYAEDAKKFKSTVEYRFRGDSTIDKPQSNNECIVANLKYVAGNEYDNPPYGGKYLMDQSYVVMAKINNEYKYYVQLIEDLPEDEGYRGIRLDLSTKLDGTKYQDEIDEETSLDSFSLSLGDIVGITDDAAMTTYLNNLKTNIQIEVEGSEDAAARFICSSGVKRVYYVA